VWGDDFHHGTPLRHALEEGLIERGQLHQIGIRASWGGPEDGALAAAHDAELHDPDAIADRGIAAIAAHVRQRIGGRPAYVTFDIDGIDPAYAPGTGTPVPGGLTAREAIRLLRGLAGVRLVGMDLVEVAPPLDHADVTCHLAAQLLFEGLALAAIAKQR
jgi:agmatinase